MDFGELERRVFSAHGGGQYEDALHLLEDADEHLADEHGGVLVFWRACFTSLLGRPADALAILDEALDRGVWADPTLLDHDPDLSAARKLEGYSELRDRLVRHKEEVASLVSPQLLVELPDHPVSEPCPAVVALHGARGSAARTRPYWSAALSAGWALVLVQASQPAGSHAFVWTDRERSLRELRQHVATLRERGDLDVGAGVLGGFSQGAALALLAVLSGDVPMTRFIAQAPSFGSIAVDPRILDDHPHPERIEGVVLVGTADRAYGDATRMAAVLEPRIGRCELEVVQDLGHDAPDDLPERLQRWLAAWSGGDR